MTVSLVTGAGSGIGAATASALGERGDRVVCADIDESAARTVAAQIPEAIHVQVDVTDDASTGAMVERVLEQCGDIDSVITCAGIELGGPVLEFDVEAFRRVVDVNLTGSFLTAQHVATAMRDKGHGGSIVLFGSINSKVALPNATAYCASKGGVLMLGKSLAVDLAPFGIRVNVVGPGVTDTPMSAESLAHPERRESLLRRIPLDRPAGPREIAQAAAFLSSEESSYLTGAFVPVDGGWLAG